MTVLEDGGWRRPSAEPHDAFGQAARRRRPPGRPRSWAVSEGPAKPVSPVSPVNPGPGRITRAGDAGAVRWAQPRQITSRQRCDGEVAEGAGFECGVPGSVLLPGAGAAV